MKKITIILFAAAAILVSLTGCNTMKGAGEDIESVGQQISGKR